MNTRSSGNRRKLAFLTDTFPALTETFVLREFSSLKDSDRIAVHPVAVRRPHGNMLNREHSAFAGSTFYFRPDRLFLLLGANIVAPLIHPVRYMRSLRVLARGLWHEQAGRWHRLIFHFFAGIYFGGYLKRKRFDGMHAHFQAAGTIAMFAHLISGIPYSMTLHASADMYHGHKPLLLEKIKHARFVVTNNRYNLAYIALITHHRYCDKLHLVYNGVDLSQFDDCRAKSDIEGRLKLLSVGSFTGVKGYPTVLNALRILKSKGVSFEYRIVGGGSAAESRMISQLIADHGLADDVDLKGRQSFTEVRDHLRWCDAMVMHSEIGEAGKRDGLPNVIIESMLSHRLVVSTYISDIPNIVKHGTTGYLVPEKDAGELAARLAHIAQHFGETLPVVEQAAALARTTFDARKNHKLLETLLGRP